MKTFKEDFSKLKNKITNDEPFAFLRFSDGELFVLQNKRLELNENHYIIGNSMGAGHYNEEERKKFLPEKHQFFREKLLESLQHKQENYYKGLSCPCCVKLEDFTFQIREAKSKIDDEDLTWSNLFINNNYPRFMEEVFPLLKEKKVIFVVNKAANFDKLNFNVIKDFRVGENCFINDYNIIEDIESYILENKIEGHYFLVSAASLSNLIIHHLYKKFPNNTFIDIGSTLNPLMGMEGWKGSRQYLLEYWLGRPSNFLNLHCRWANLELVDNSPEYWETIRTIRFAKENLDGFLNSVEVTKEQQQEYMGRYGDCYKICLLDGIPVGFIGDVGKDIRLGVSPSYKGLGIGQFMLSSFMEMNKVLKAKVKNDNIASKRVFEKCGFRLVSVDERFHYYDYEKD